MDLKFTNKESPEEMGSTLSQASSTHFPDCCLYSRLCGLQKLKVSVVVVLRAWGPVIIACNPSCEVEEIQLILPSLQGQKTARTEVGTMRTPVSRLPPGHQGFDPGVRSTMSGCAHPFSPSHYRFNMSRLCYGPGTPQVCGHPVPSP